MRFEVELREKEASVRQSDKHLLEAEALLRHEQDRTSQLQQTVQDGKARILTLENQMIIEQNKWRELQQEVIAKGDEVSRLLSISPLVQVSRDFSAILIELYASHWEKINNMAPRFSLCWDSFEKHNPFVWKRKL